MLSSAGSLLLFQEIVVALAGLVQLFETQFVAIAAQMAEEEKQRAAHGHYLTLPAGGTTGACVRACCRNACALSR